MQSQTLRRILQSAAVDTGATLRVPAAVQDGGEDVITGTSSANSIWPAASCHEINARTAVSDHNPVGLRIPHG